MAGITTAVLYLSSRLVLWMRFLYLNPYGAYTYCRCTLIGVISDLIWSIVREFPQNYREVTIKNIAIFYFPFVDLCFVLYMQYDKFHGLQIYFFLMGKLNDVQYFYKI